MHGLTQEKLAEFFLAFTQLSAALEVAKAAPTTAPPPPQSTVLQANTAAESVRALAPPAVEVAVVPDVAPTPAGEIMLTIPDGQPTQKGKRSREPATEADGDAAIQGVGTDDGTSGEDDEDDELDFDAGQRAVVAFKVASDAITQATAGGKNPPAPVVAAVGSPG